MKKQFKAFWLALVGVVWLLLMAAACHKTPEPEPNPDPDLPTITQTGAGTIGCYINGKPWVPKPYIAIGVPKYLQVVFRESDNKVLSINAILDGSFGQGLFMTSFNTKVGENLLVKSNDYEFLDLTKNSGCNGYHLDTISKRSLLVSRLDKVEKIVSGTFEFTVINDNCNDTLRFTKGRFDAKF